MIIDLQYDKDQRFHAKKLSENLKFNRKHLMKQIPNIEEKKFR